MDYNVINRFYMKLFFFVVFLASSFALSAQMVMNTSGNPNVCAGVITRFSYSGSCGGGIMWRVEPEGATIVSSTNSYADIRWDTPIGSTYVSAICSGNSNQNGSTAPFQVYAPTTPSVSISGPSTVCVGSVVTYQATPTNGGTAPSYNWKVNGVSKQTGTSSQFDYNELIQDDVVTVQMTSNMPCATSTSATSNSIIINAANQPSNVQVLVTQSGALCSTDVTQNVTFNAMSTNGGGNPTFTWYRASSSNGEGEPVQDNELPANGNAYKPHYPLQNNERVWCVMTSSLGGCLSNNPAKSNEVILSIASPTAATINITPSKYSFCSGEVVTFTASSNASLSNFSWQFNTGSPDGNITSITSSITGPFSTGSTVTVTASASGYCVLPGPVSASAASLPLNVHQLPDAAISPYGNQAIASTGSVTINTQSQPGHSYQWKRNGAEIPAPAGTLNPLITTTAGTYTVTIKSANNCASTTVNPLVLTKNSAPVVNAGGDVTLVLPVNFVTLNGLSSDADGSIVSHAWTQVSGPSNAALTNENTPSVAISGMKPGTYIFRLTATDNFPESNADEVTVSVVLPANNYNYIRETLVLQKGTQESQIASLSIGEKSVTTTYFDGLGNPMQIVNHRASPAKNDVILPIVYDEIGREYRKYLPVVINETNGFYKSGILDSEGSYAGSALNFYGNSSDDIADDIAPYAETVFEPSPLNRVLKQGAPGVGWQPAEPHNYGSSDHTIKRSYAANTANDKVLKWTYTAPTMDDSLGTVNASLNVFYNPGKLHISLTKDEQQNEVIEYTDTEGKVILKRVQATASQSVSDINYASTYYIYDDLNNLVCVIPPEASKRIAQENSAYIGKSPEEKTRFLQQWAFRYKYDHRKRMIIKQVPGAKYVYMLYDNRDRLVMTQDGRQRALTDKEWTFTKYDAMNRPVLTGTHVSSTSPSSLQNDINVFYSTVDNSKAWFENYIGSGAGNVMGYDNKSFPQISDVSKYLTATYYDRYDEFIAPPASQGHEGYAPLSQSLPNEITGNQNNVMGLVTATSVKNLQTGAWLRTVNYYDDKYRVIQTIADHHKGTVRTSNVYDFTGRLLHSQRRYFVSGKSKIIKESFTYDHAGRQLSVTHAIDDAIPVVMVMNEYNELGQLVTKNLHKTLSKPYVTADPAIGQPGVAYGSNIILPPYNSAQHTQISNNWIKLATNFKVLKGSTFKARIGYSQQDADAHNSTVHEYFQQVIDYRYNIRGWLSKINDPVAPVANDLFNMELRYNMPSSQGGNAQYNGNISEAVWKSAGLAQQSYGYSYDNMNRLTEAKYFNIARPQTQNGKYDDKNGRYDEKIGVNANRPTYDLNGNILNLLRKGKTAEGTYNIMDDLHYDYIGNRLIAVSDAVPTDAQEEGFKEISGGEGALVDYLYDANGNMIKDKNKAIDDIKYNYLNLPSKVSKNANEYIIYTYDATGRKLAQQVFGTEAKVTDYIGELVYEDGALQFINHSEGRAIPETAGQWEYQYFMKDHLGNTRVVFSERNRTTEYKATMEDNTQNNEAASFRNYNGGVRSAMLLFDHTDAGTAYTYSQLLNGGSNSQVGLAKSFEVNPGDIFDLEVYAKYEAPGSTDNNVSALLSQLVSAFSLGAGTTPLDGSQAQTAFNNLLSSGPWVTSSKWDEGAPKAYLNYVLFNENFVVEDLGFDQISTAGAQSGTTPVPHDYLSLHVKVEKKGYLYVYLSNEQSKITNVYFDDMRIVRYTGVEQVSDYYPFGLTFNSYQRENAVDQDYLYNGKEIQDELALGWLDYGARMYMPDVGRWGSIDPHASKYEIVTPYNYGFSNPMLFVDPNGKDNIIYLIVGTGMTRAQANDAAKKANTMLEKLGLKTQVKVYDSKKNGKFDEGKLDKTDNWAVIGTDRKGVAKMAKEISRDESYRFNLDGWAEGAGNPERSNNAENGKGIVVDYDDNFVGKDKAEEAALFTIHGAGHSAKEIIKSKDQSGEYGHLDQGVMKRGSRLYQTYRDYGIEAVLEPNKSKVLKGNETYIKAMMSRYGTRKPTDNYGKQ